MERQTAVKAQKTPARAKHQQAARSSSATHRLLQLQSSLGNQAVQRLIHSSYIQTKLQVSTPGDPFEQEADRVADTVMRTPEPSATNCPSQHVVVQQMTPFIHRTFDHKESKTSVGTDKPRIVQRRTPPLAVREDDDEEKVARMPDTHESAETDTDKFDDDSLEHKKPLQRQTREDDEPTEEKLQAPLPIQRQLEDEEEELVSPKIEPGALIQRLCTECELEHQKDEQPAAAVQRASSTEQPQSGSNLEQRLANSKGAGTSLPHQTRSFFESQLGADFTGVQVHTGADAVAMNKELGAHAFTHGSDIYFNAGKYDPGSSSGKRLLAHELTHTVQQQGGSARRKIQRWPDWVSDAADWVRDTASDAAGAVVEGAEYVGGKVVGGARWVGGQVADGARWVGDQISAAAQWVIDQIRSVINSGTNYLTEQWENIKQFGSSCFDTIKTGFGNLVRLVTNPLSSLMSALSAMDADLLGSVWRLLKTGANALWEAIDSVINGVLQRGEGIWSTVSGFINGIFNTIAGLFDNSAFDLLPDFIKDEARSILNGLRSLWNQVSTFWTDLWQRLTSSVQEILAGVRSFVENVIGFSIDRVISMVRGLKEVYDYVMKFFANPRATIQPFLDQIAAKLNAEAPPRANALGNQMAQDNYQGGVTPTANIQRQESDSEDRDTASFDEVGKGILYYIAQFWAELDIKEMLWQTVVNSFWPPATIEAICKEFSDLWNDHWATTVDSLYTPRNFFDHPIGCLHDIWSNFLILLDFPLSLWRTLNHVAGLLMGYVTIIVVLVEAILGGIAATEVGVVPGLLAGAAAGLATMAPIGEALMASYLLAESSTVVIILLRLFTARQTCEKRQVDISTAVSSFITMAVALVLQVLMALLAELVNLIASVLKGTPKPVPQPQPVTPPARPGLPPPAPNPIPAPPQPQPVPVQPPAPVQPAAPAGGGQVIPFPGRRAPVPVTPSVPGRVAAKFEDGVSHAPFLETRNNNSSAETADNSDRIRESNLENEGISLSGIQDAEDGIVQTARGEKIDPDACKEEKCDLPYKWTRNNPTVPGNEVLRYCEKKKNNFQKDGHHSWPKYLGGPEDQSQLLPVDHNVHMQEFHGNQGRIGPNPPIHTHIEIYLNSSNDYKNLLKGNPLTTRTTSIGNQLLIEAMRIGGGNDAVLRSRVKNQMMLFYGLYSAASKPQMPVSAYSVGLNTSENNIR